MQEIRIPTNLEKFMEFGGSWEHLTKEVANEIAVSTVTSCLDYCNSTLQGISSEELDRLQKTQNSAAEIPCSVLLQ